MSVSEAIKDLIDTLPDNQFTLAWQCIEEINEAILHTGPVRMLALQYVKAKEDEHIVQLVATQDEQIDKLCNNLSESLCARTLIVKENNELKAKVHKLKSRAKKNGRK